MAQRVKNPVRKRTEEDYEYQRAYQAKYTQTEAGIATKKKYKENITTVYVHLHERHDADILEFLRKYPDLPLGSQAKTLMREAINVRTALKKK